MFENRNVVCFGLGPFFNSYIARLSQEIEIKYVCDNDWRKWNKKFTEKEILCVNIDYFISIDNPLVIITVDALDSIRQIENQLENMGIEHYHARDIMERIEYIPDNGWIQKLNYNRIHAFIDLDIRGTTICNFCCEYCYVWRKSGFGEGRVISTHSAKEIRNGISQEKLGGPSFVNLCARGETFLAENIEELIFELLEEGHYVSVVTNGTITDSIKKIVEFPLELQKRMFFKLSFHYIELRKRKLFNIFWNNVERIKNSSCSYTLEITPCDGLVEYIPDLKQMFEKEAGGAMPHISFARDSTKKGLDVLSEYSLDEYKKIWGQFDSKMFDLKSRNYGEKITQFCYAGAWSYLVNALTGEIRSCYRQEPIGNIFNSDLKVFPKISVGHNCSLDYCFNNHAFMAWGDIPDKKEATYLEMRDRIEKDGRHWVKEPMHNFMNDKLFETNFIFGDFWTDYEKLFNSNRKPAFLMFNSPDYPNIGDMAIALGEKIFLNKYFPEYDVIEISCKQYELENRRIKKVIKPEDVIFITGGGNIGSFWLNIEDYITKIITDFKENKIFIFPQTLFFEKDKIGEKEKAYLRNVVRSHRKVFIAVRERESFKLVRENFVEEANIDCVPDMALSLSLMKYNKTRKGALLCIRNDKESLGWKKEVIEKRLKCYIDEIECIDCLPVKDVSLEKREEQLQYVCNILASKRLVITDRLHCMILCALTETPCIALDNVSQKVSGVYQWISSLSYVEFINSVDEIEETIDNILNAVCTGKTRTFDALQLIFTEYAEKIKRELKHGC